MTNAERAAVLKRMVTVLKKNFKVERPDVNRKPIEQLIYAICLENASFSAADDVYNALTHNYFDWNEVRVSSSRELAETMKNLPEPAQTGLRLKRILHYVFDQKYAFEIDEIKKMSVKTFNEYVAKMENVTPFNSAYVMMTVMGRHAIPVSSGEFEVLDILGLIDDKDREKNSVSWLERVIEKKKANEFFSLLHQLAALYVKNPYGRKVMEILTAIVPSCKDRIPKRRKPDEEIQPALPELASEPAPAESKPEPEVKDKPEVKPADKPEEKKSSTEQKSAEQKPVQKKAAEKKSAEKKPAEKKTVEKKAPVKKAEPKPTEKKAVEKKAAVKKTVEKKPVEKKTAEKKAVEKKATVKKATEKKPAEKKTVEKKPATKKTAEKKPAEKKTSTAKSTAAKSASAKSATAKSAPVKKTTAASKASSAKASKSTTAKAPKKSK